MVPLATLQMDKLMFLRPLLGQRPHTPVPVDTHLMVPAQEHVKVVEPGQEQLLLVKVIVNSTTKR